MKGILGRKVGMTQIYQESGAAVTVTVLPPRPFVSTRSFATTRSGTVALPARRWLHWQSRCGHPHFGHFPPVEVE